MEALTNEQLCALARGGDTKARSFLVGHNLGYIRQAANGIFSQQRELCLAYGIEADDFIQEGCIGLLKAIDLFDPELGNKFLTYAAPSIRNAMWDLIRTHSSLYEQKMQDVNGPCMMRVGLYDIVGDEEKSQRIELIADAFVKSPEQICIKAETLSELHNALSRISPRDRAYLLYRFGFVDDIEHPIPETAEHFNLTVSNVKRTEKLALDNVWLELPWWF